jgi:predicted nuclease with TOPRIM domain
MSKLYELTQNYQNLLDLLDNPEIPQDIIQEALNSVGEDIEVKVENIAKLIKSIEVDAKGFKEEEQRLATRRKSLENRIDSLKDYIEGAMRATSREKVKGKIFTLAIQKNAPSVDIVDLEAIPEEYFVVTKELTKKQILEALKAGIEVPGAQIKQTESLRIR